MRVCMGSLSVGVLWSLDLSSSCEGVIFFLLPKTRCVIPLCIAIVWFTVHLRGYKFFIFRITRVTIWVSLSILQEDFITTELLSLRSVILRALCIWCSNGHFVNMIHEMYDNIQGEQSHEYLCSCCTQGGHVQLLHLGRSQHTCEFGSLPNILLKLCKRGRHLISAYSVNAISRKFVFWQ